MKEKIKLILKSMMLIIILLFFPAFLLGILQINPNTISDKEYIIYLTISNIIVFLIFIVLYHKDLLKDFNDLKKNFKKYLPLTLKYWFIGYIIMIISNVIITFILNKQISGNEEIIRNYLKISPILIALDAIIHAPFTEELTFRKSIKDFINNKYIYIIISGFLFGFMHIISHIHNISDLVYLIPYSAVGISFAITYYKTNNIFPTMIMHGVHNTLALLLYLIGASL